MQEVLYRLGVRSEEQEAEIKALLKNLVRILAFQNSRNRGAHYQKA
jgi:hypothetical protein